MSFKSHAVVFMLVQFKQHNKHCLFLPFQWTHSQNLWQSIFILKNSVILNNNGIIKAPPVSISQLSVWLWLWVRCWVCPLFVRLPVSPLPLSQSIFHLCAVGCRSSRKWCSVSTSELWPACIHVRLCCSWFCFPPPLNLCCRSNCQRCSQCI